MSVTDKLLEALRELKRDIIQGYTYREIELETNKGGTYRQENFIYSNNRILYFCRERSNSENYSGGSVLFDTPENFLKAPLEEIIELINAAYYYNVLAVSD